jgi:hypothetical protein
MVYAMCLCLWSGVVLGATHNANGVVLAELISYFKGSVTKHADTAAGGGATCPDGKTILWGHSIMYNSVNGGGNDCMETRNTVCKVGDKTCSVNACVLGAGNTDQLTVGRVQLLCADEVIPGSYLVSNHTQNGAPARASCQANDKVVFGIKYMFPYEFDNCPWQAEYQCDWGATACEHPTTSVAWPNCVQTLHVTNILCAPAKYADALAEYGALETIASDTSDNTALSCENPAEVLSSNGLNVGARSLMLLGARIALSDAYEVNDVTDDVHKLKKANKVCGGGQTVCSHEVVDTAGSKRFGGAVMCVPEIEITSAPNAPPTASPSTPPTAVPSALPTAQPNVNPSRRPTSLLAVSTRSPTSRAGESSSTAYLAAGLASVAAIGLAVSVSTFRKRQARLHSGLALGPSFAPPPGLKLTGLPYGQPTDDAANLKSMQSFEPNFESRAMSISDARSPVASEVGVFGRQLTDSVLRPTSHGQV